MEPINIVRKLFSEGKALWDQKRYSKAINKFEKVMSRCDKTHWFYPEFLESYACILSEANKCDEAIEKFKLCEEEHRGRGEAVSSNEVILPRLGIAETHIKKGEVDIAIQLLERYAKDGGKSVFLLYECLAFAYHSAGEPLKARAAALNAIKVVAQDRDASNYEKRFETIIGSRGS
jgi:tetratricopeptide (TPR) repeat protein